MNDNYSVSGVIGKDLSENHIKATIKDIIKFINKNKLPRKVLVAKDNRQSGDYIVALIQSILLKSGIDVDLMGITTTPCMVYTANKFKYSVGIMVTAPKFKQYNGLKTYFLASENGLASHNKYGKSKEVHETTEFYIRKLKNELKCKNKYIFDCANGVSVDMVRRLFPRHKIIGDDQTGEYINDCFGMKHIQTLSNLCKKTAMVGFAFNEDGRGVIAVDESGKIIDSNQIVYILSKFYLMAGAKVGVADNASLGLDVSLRKLGISVARKPSEADISVDKFGYITFDNMKCADGIHIAIKLISILEQSKMTFDELLSEYKQYYSIQKEVSCEKPFYNKVSKEVRVVISRMDESTLQIFVEGLDKSLVEKEFNQIIGELELWCG